VLSLAVACRRDVAAVGLLPLPAGTVASCCLLCCRLPSLAVARRRSAPPSPVAATCFAASFATSPVSRCRSPQPLSAAALPAVPCRVLILDPPSTFQLQ